MTFHLWVAVPEEEEMKSQLLGAATFFGFPRLFLPTLSAVCLVAAAFHLAFAIF